MKKTLVLGILGLALGSATLQAQSTIELGNYVGGNFISTPITYAASGVPAGSEGDAIGSGFSVTAYYSTDSGATWIQVTGQSTGAFFGTDGDSGSGAGYFYVGFPTLATATPGVAVQMYLVAYNTVTVGGYAPGQIVGQSAVFSITPVAPDAATIPTLADTTYAGFTVAIIPEPSTFALAGLGLAGLLIFRRRK